MKRLLNALEELEGLYSSGYLKITIYSDESGFVSLWPQSDDIILEFDDLKDAYKEIKKLTKQLSE